MKRSLMAVIVFLVWGAMAVLARGPIEPGRERWPVKTGSDDGVGKIASQPVPTTVERLRNLARPAELPSRMPEGEAEKQAFYKNRLAPVETTVYRVEAVMTRYKLEDDGDYHIVIEGEPGSTMIVEIPKPVPPFVAATSPLLPKIGAARAIFDSHVAAERRFKRTHARVRVTGVGFFDYLHGQEGVAPNGIELHPVLDIKFL